MNTFLKEIRKLRNLSSNTCVILGNESCDLDSAVSALSLAYFYHKNPNRFPVNKAIMKFLPILNISRDEYPLKTEVLYFLQRNKIEAENLTFKNEVEEDFIQKSTIVLVDHHFSPYSALAAAIFDHRPLDTSVRISESCYREIVTVGSCATLVGMQILQEHDTSTYLEPLRLLHAAIVLDTGNFSKDADKAKPLDFEVTTKIEELLQIENPLELRHTLFNELITARSDLSSLNSYQIIFKDLKLVSSNSGRVKVAFPAFPFLFLDYLQMESAEVSLKRFAATEGCSIMVLIGLKFTNSAVYRDLGIINISNEQLFMEVVDTLLTHREPNLELEEYFVPSLSNGRFFKQRNQKASRKQILPIVKMILDQH